LYAVNTTAFGVANTAWPMRGHDPQRLSRFTGFPPCEIPVITNEPKDSTIRDGEAVQLTVGASGTSLSYKWYKGLDKSTPVGSGESFVTPDLKEITSYWVEVSNTCGVANSRSAKINTTVTGIIESGYESFEVRIYPNPSKEKFLVECDRFKIENSTILLYDLYGRQLFEKHFPAGTGNLEIETRWLQRGMYFCLVKSGTQSVLRKIIKL
jgi:hypothetical protein